MSCQQPPTSSFGGWGVGWLGGGFEYTLNSWINRLHIEINYLLQIIFPAKTSKKKPAKTKGLIKTCNRTQTLFNFDQFPKKVCTLYSTVFKAPMKK